MKTQFVGILNYTPDSFSDGQQHNEKNAALKHIDQLIEEGASVIDIGAESTRPNATPLSASEEWQRLQDSLPELVQHIHQQKILVSLDSYHPKTAKRALDLGVDWINDVTGLTNPAMIEAVRHSPCKLVMMHNLGVPVDPKVTVPVEEDIIEVITDWAKESLAILEQQGITRSRILLDPGIGFGKTAHQSYEIIKRIEELHDLNIPLYVGHSRKSFIKSMVTKATPTRDLETAILSASLAKSGVDYIRVHAVQENINAVQLSL